MIDCTSPDIRAAYALQLTALDNFFAQECYRATVGFFPTRRMWICPSCGSSIDDIGIPKPVEISHKFECAWMQAFFEWPKDLVDFYIAAWMQRHPMSKRLIRAACPVPQTPNPSES